MPRSGRAAARRAVAALGLGAALLLALCSQEHNPFADSANARVMVLRGSHALADGDSVHLFSTRYLYLAALVREEVDSFRVRADSSRYWRHDTTIVSPSTQDYVLPVSFVDTGVKTIEITTYRSVGDLASQVLHFHVTSPLHQADLYLRPDSQINFSTPAVGDTDVLYHWSYGSSTPSAGGSLPRDTLNWRYPQATLHLSNLPSSLEGLLWVSDTQGSFMSPAVAFSIHTVDSSGPLIRGLSDAGNLDTLRTSGDTLVFLVQVLDDGGVGLVEIDSQAVGPVGPSVYRMIFTGLSRRTSALAVPVRAKDVTGNTTLREFSIIYDSTAHRLQNMSIVLRETAGQTNRNKYQIVGDVLDNSHDSVWVRATVNDTAATDSIPVGLLDSRGDFGLYVRLSLGTNQVQIRARARDGASAQASVTIMYNESYIDTKPPVISDVRVGGRTAAENQTVTVHDSVALVVVTAYDESGIDSLSINGSLGQPVPGKPYQWQATLHGLTHSSPTALRIDVVDSVGNARPAYQAWVDANLMPTLTGPGLPALMLVNRRYVADLYVFDEADSVAVTLLGNTLQGMQAAKVGSPNHWTITWTPALADTGPHSVAIKLDDGAQDTVIAWQFSVVQAPPPSVRLSSDLPAFPAYLQAGVDTLVAALAREPGTGSLPLHFVVYLRGRSGTLLDVNVMDSMAALRWTPAAGDTGLQRLVIKVSDAQGADSIVRNVTVVPRNSHPCSLTVTIPPGTDTTAAGELDLSTATAPVTLSFAIIDADNPFTEHYTRSVTRGGVTTVEYLDSARSFQLVLDTASSVRRDTIRVVVSDATGTSDTLSIRVVYRAPRPRPAAGWVWPQRFVAGVHYAMPFAVVDLERSVAVSLQNAPAGLAFDPAAGVNQFTLNWTPATGDSGSHDVQVRLNDGFRDTIMDWRFVVLADSSRLVRFLTTTIGLPLYLQAGDTLPVLLMVVPGSGAPPYRYSVRRAGAASALLDSSASGSVLWRWLPQAADTGAWQMVLTVRDSYGDADTLYYFATVLPRNSHPCSLSVSWPLATDTTAYGEIDLRPPHAPVALSFVIHDADNPLTEHYTVRVLDDGAGSVMTLDTVRHFTLTLDTSGSRYRDTLTVIVTDATNTSDTLSVRAVHKVPMPRPVTPWQWPRRFVAGVTYALPFGVEADGNAVTITPQAAPAGLRFVPTAGFNRFTLAWTPAVGQTGAYVVGVQLGDGYQDTTCVWNFSVVSDSSKLVRFQTKSDSLPSFVKLSDSVVANLRVVAGTGSAPYRYVARLVGPNPLVLDTTIASGSPARLRWIPTVADLGTRQFVITVSDGFGDADTFYHDILVVPNNTDPCRLTRQLPPGADTSIFGALDMRFAPRPDTVTYRILDTDDPRSEDYTVTVRSRTMNYTQVFDSARSFSVVIDNRVLLDRDTVVVTVSDGASQDSSVLRVLYSLNAPASFGATALQAQADGSSQYVVHHPFAGSEYVDRWAAPGALLPFVTNPSAGREPVYDTAFGGRFSVLSFDRTFSSNLTVNNAQLIWNWIDGAFTVFFVARLDTLVAGQRYTLLASGPHFGRYLALGVAGGNATAFTDVTVPNTGLAVTKRAWAVYSFRSNGRIAGNMTVQVWLSGVAGAPANLVNVVNMTALTIGATEHDVGTNGWTGAMAEMLMYGGSLSDADRRSVERYLGEKYGIVVP